MAGWLMTAFLMGLAQFLLDCSAVLLATNEWAMTFADGLITLVEGHEDAWF